MKRTCEHCGLTFDTWPKLHAHRHVHTPFEQITSKDGRKVRLLQTRGRRCENCKNTEWMGQPIPITVDHIDGNSDNNVEANLRLLCPNCHAQTPTFSGRNVGKFPYAKRYEKRREKSETN